MTELGNVGELVGLADKLVYYKHNLSYGYFFFVFGCLFAGWLLVLIATEWIQSPYFLIPSVFACAAVGTAIHRLVSVGTFRRVKRQRVEIMRWIFSFSVPFIGVYTLLGVLNVSDIFFMSGFAWYLALGIALTLVAILIENWYVRSKMLLTRPFLIAGVMFLLTSPLLLLISHHVHGYSGNPLGLGLMLLIYFVSGTVTIVRTEDVFK